MGNAATMSPTGSPTEGMPNVRSPRGSSFVSKLNKARLTDSPNLGLKLSNIGESSDDGNNDGFLSSKANSTEGQQRREVISKSDMQCSKIAEHLYVGGKLVATSWDIISRASITRIVNCCCGIVESKFLNNPQIEYLMLNMLDGREDDIGWFVCEVIHFIHEGISSGKNTLVHCERGISRSCSFVIAYHMWINGLHWKESFEHVRQHRPACGPNTAFTCNLIEFDDLLNGGEKRPIIFRLAVHLVAHDPNKPVLKLCRYQNTRRVMVPSTSLLDPRGVFVIRIVTADASGKDTIYIWQGAQSSAQMVAFAHRLASYIPGIYAAADAAIVVVSQGSETEAFNQHLVQDATFGVIPDPSLKFSDLFLSRADPPLALPSYSTSHINGCDEDEDDNGSLKASSNSHSLPSLLNDKDPADKVLIPLLFKAGSVKRRSLHDPPESVLSFSKDSDGRDKDPFTGAKHDTGKHVEVRKSSPSNIFMRGGRNNVAAMDTTSHSGEIPVVMEWSRSVLIPQKPHDPSPSSSRKQFNRMRSSPKSPEPCVGDLNFKKMKMESSSSKSVSESSACGVAGAYGIPAGAELSPETKPRVTSSNSRSKPQLFQAVLIPPGHEHGSGPDGFSHSGEDSKEATPWNEKHYWLAMGVYDDGDLHEAAILLLCGTRAEGQQFLWVGSEVDLQNLAPVYSLKPDESNEESIIRHWCANVDRGDVALASAYGEALLKANNVSVERSGSESNNFWTAFCEGF